jgi:WD40 repeat protein
VNVARSPLQEAGCLATAVHIGDHQSKWKARGEGIPSPFCFLASRHCAGRSPFGRGVRLFSTATFPGAGAFRRRPLRRAALEADQPAADVNSVAWSTVGRRLAFASADGTVRVWWVGDEHTVCEVLPNVKTTMRQNLLTSA